VLLASCQEREAPVTDAKDFGAALFADKRVADSEFNDLACSTCHDALPAGATPGRIFPGGTLHDVVGRPSYFGGYERNLLSAINFCYVYFMRGFSGLTADDPRAKSLYEFLVSLSPSPRAPAVPMTIVKDVTDVPRGDVARGAAVYAGACGTCHGDANTGAGRIGPDAVILPNVTRTYRQDFPGVEPSLVVIEKVRHGQFFHIGGNMPFFSKETLSDADLGALLAFLGL